MIAFRFIMYIGSCWRQRKKVRVIGGTICGGPLLLGTNYQCFPTCVCNKQIMLHLALVEIN